MNRKLEAIRKKNATDRRIDGREALFLLENADLLHLAALADNRRKTRHPESLVTYVVDRNINYTNICVSGCRFCAFYRPPGHAEGFILSKTELTEKIAETVAMGGTQILLQGGMHPDLDLDYYLDLLRFIKAGFPVHILSLIHI